MSMRRELRAEGKEADLKKMSVAELCGEICEAPAYDAKAGITRQQLANAYERLRLVAVELAEWVDGSGDARDALERVGKGGAES
jgi:hypothetical protein